MIESPPPFNKIDKLKLSVLGFDLTSIFKPYGWRKYVMFFAIASGLAWIFFGYEGCFDQVEWGANYFLGYIAGERAWSEVSLVMQDHYGIATHFSAAVIYGVMFYALSKYYEIVNIKGSLNLFMSFALTVLSVSLFEFTWMASYYTAQRQFWVLVPLTKQASILYQNLAFLLCGIVLIIFVIVSPYRFRINKKFGFLLFLSISMWSLWFFYPFPTTKLQVTLDTGEVWTSYQNFPQTMYTIDRNPYDNDAVGEPFFVEDNLVHTVNTTMKIVWAYTIFYVGKVTLGRTKKNE